MADKRIDLAYNALGQFSTVTRYQSTSTTNLVATSTYTYDTLNRLTDLDHKQNTTNLALYDFAYDHMDRITSMTHSVDGASAYSYDKTNQVTAADHASPQSDESYSFDSTGNRTGGSYTNTTNNRTTSDGTYDYTYDNEGNRTRKTNISTGDYEQYAWDHRNRLVSVTFYDSMDQELKSVEHSYDTLNRWVRRTYDADGPGGNDPVNTFFAGYDGINPSLQFDDAAASDLTNRYLFNPEVVDQIFADENVTSLGSAGNVQWPLADHQGTPRDIADLNEGSGVTSVTNHRFYDGFGNLKSETNAAVDLIFEWMGKAYEQHSKLYNFYNRPYDSFLGELPTHDPITFGGGDANLARMVGNNVINLTDPYGLESSGPVTISTAGTCADASNARATSLPIDRAKMRMMLEAILRPPAPAPVTRIESLPGATVHLNDAYFPPGPWGVPCIVCHGVTAQGVIGPPNSFRLPGGPPALLGAMNVRDWTVTAAVFVAEESAGGVVVAVVGPAVAAPVGATTAGSSTTLTPTPMAHMLGPFFRGAPLTPSAQTVAMLYAYLEIARRNIEELSRMNPPRLEAIAVQQERIRMILEQLSQWGL